MPDMQKLHDNKEKILSIIRNKGPSFPGRISSETGINPLFASALLAELSSEKRLRISNLKVGSSPLYFIPGQEAELENFSQHLNSKEKEAFSLLKENSMLQDEALPPAIRVALRSLKDFAVPLNIRLSDETKLFWKYFSFPESGIREKVQDIIIGKVPKPTETAPTPPQTSPSSLTAPKSTAVKQPLQLQSIKEQEIVAKKPKIPKPKQPSEFANTIREYLDAKDIEILEELSEKKKEFTAKIRTDELFGKQEFYMIAKEKKKVSTTDLTLAYQQAQNQKMPALFISPGELDKKASEHIKEWRNLIKFEQIKI